MTTTELPEIGSVIHYNINGQLFPVRVVSISPSGHKITCDKELRHREPEETVFTRRSHGKYVLRGTDYAFLRI